jgi:amidophosphoribosyltransferase
VQPFYARTALGEVAIAHNGNLINADLLKTELISQGAIFSATSDTEVILHLLARNAGYFKRNGRKDLAEAVIGALKEIRGAYSLLILFKDRIFGVRDPNGFRPLCLGRLNGSFILASETCALDLLGASYVRDIAPGEVIEIPRELKTENEIQSYFPFGVRRESPCIFEYVYFSRPDSNVFGRNVYQIRRRMGMELAREHPVKADIVVPVPDSGVTAALGFAEESQVPLELGLIRNHYIGRTFIQPKQSIRDFGVRIKLNANPAVLWGKRIVVVDDSIVRGTTSRKLVEMLRHGGAKEVHVRISAPPTIGPCYYGIDTPEKSELIAAQKSVKEIGEYLGADSIGYLSIEGLYRAVQTENGKFCDACFTGRYPVGTPKQHEDRQLEMFS